MSGSTPTDISKHVENFYKYAYTSLLQRQVVSSCDSVISYGESLQQAIEVMFKDMQEMLYNCTSEETTAVQQDLEDPQTSAARTIDDLADLISALRRYKLRLLSTGCK